MRRVKIVATIGPATDSVESIRRLIASGMDVARLNFSHGSHEEHSRSIDIIRQVARELDRPVAILQDLQGVKIRTGPLEGDQPVELDEGQEFVLTTEPIPGTKERVSASYAELPNDVSPGDRILLSDGLIELEVLSTREQEVVCRVSVGGTLRENQGINLPGTSIAAQTLTEKDHEDLYFGLKNSVDYVALSFVRSAHDIDLLRQKIAEAGGSAPVIAKIEKPQAVDELEEIIRTADGIMVARGDLGVEVSPEEVPIIQKRAVRLTAKHNKIVIIATQMLDSMIDHPLPTRAEASDVANAVLDGADALMLSGETAVGRYPVKSIEMMARIIVQAEKLGAEVRPVHPEVSNVEVPFAICDAAYRAARAVSAKGIIAFTQTGSTAKLISNYRPDRSVLAFTPHERIANQMCLFWGVQPLLMREIRNVDQLVGELEKVLLQSELVEPGDRLVIISGAPIVEKGSTNLMKIHEVKPTA